MISRFTKILAVLIGLPLALPAAALAQSSPGYFIPPSPGSAPGAAAPVHHAAPQPSAPAPQAPAPQAQAPQIPQLPALPKGAPPPVPVVGVLSVPDVMQGSTAAQGVQQIINNRRQALANEAKRDQAGWEVEQAGINADRSKLTDAQLEAREKTLQDEIAAAQTSFQARNQAIQNSAQAALGQIESVLIAVIRQVAEARGMNLVLHREQVALNVDAFDITSDVAAQLNKLLPSVPVPPSVVTPGMPIQQQDQGDDNGQGP